MNARKLNHSPWVKRIQKIQEPKQDVREISENIKTLKDSIDRLKFLNSEINKIIGNKRA